MPRTKEPSEAEVLFNRANVALAKNQRLVESWLPPRASEPAASPASISEQVRDEEEMFTPVPELLGVGATAQNNAVSKAGEMSAMDKLKRQLLGKGATMSKVEPAKKKPAQPVSSSADGPLDDDDSEEEGRVGAISSKSAPKAKSRNAGRMSRSDEKEDDSADEQLNHDQKNRPISAIKGPKRHSSFLDEVLSKSSAKKKRKKQN